MAHVQIRQGDSCEKLQIIVDGVDLSMHVFTEGLGLVRVGEGEFQEWGVSMIVAPDSLDIDLPDAVIQAVREVHATEEAGA